MNMCRKNSNNRDAFTLAELMVVIVIAAMIMVTVIAIYANTKRSAISLQNRLGENEISTELLQRIAEDLDRVVLSGDDVKIEINNKLQAGYKGAQLIIRSYIQDEDGKKDIFEEIIWRSDEDDQGNGLVLYRSHSGYVMEDKLLDASKEKFELGKFVPICNGITFFQIQALKGEEIRDRWTSSAPTKGVSVTVSFAEPFEAIVGGLDVLDEEKITRTIALDRTSQMKFVFIPKKFPAKVAREHDTGYSVFL